MGFLQFHPNVKLRLILNFTNNLLTNMFTPFMAVYFAKSLGTTAAGAAAILAVVVSLVFAALGGYYADRFGRKRIMVYSEMLCTAAFCTMALANSPWLHSAILTFGMTLVMNAGAGFGRPAIDAMLIDVSAPETRKSIYRVNYWAKNLSLSIAGVVGAYLFSDYLFEIFIFVAAMSLITVLVMQLFISETMPDLRNANANKDASLSKRTSLWASYRLVVRDSTFMLYLLAGLLTVSIERNLSNYMSIRLEDQMQEAAWLPWLSGHVSGLEMLGFLRTENTLLVVVLSLFIGRLFRRSDGRMMLIAIALNVIGYTYIALGSQPSLLILFMFIATVGEVLYLPIMQALLANLVPDGSRSAYMAVNGMSYQVSTMIAGLNVILGGFFSAWGMSALILVTGLIAMFIMMSILPKLEGRRLPLQAAPGRSL
ncbi:MFS transporter [Cohnella lubricantis]|uniref:MFS transporter n=1 Tax=Cohnella lubricantis TaxID=2163172 RepID=A0A841TGI1_9BACL|nr:MFS transporter [Cohnella lubricantis]MBB6678057.1 MFS transporter [Cohnella lubricantis]MBP2120034.1 DHA1 family multidrug resistance protein B-like MFS transporter [Cohnella lubricantis]